MSDGLQAQCCGAAQIPGKHQEITNMADEIDQAKKFEELSLERSLRAQQEHARLTTRPKAVGHCLNPQCLEPFEASSPRLFCGPKCAERFEAKTPRNRA